MTRQECDESLLINSLQNRACLSVAGHLTPFLAHPPWSALRPPNPPPHDDSDSGDDSGDDSDGDDDSDDSGDDDSDDSGDSDDDDDDDDPPRAIPPIGPWPRGGSATLRHARFCKLFMF